MTQQGDVLLFQTLNDGDISVRNGVVEMTQGLETSVYLSLFSPEDWFLNDVAETEKEKLKSETSQVIKNKPNKSANYQLLNQAVNNDLAWLIEDGLAKSVDVDISSNALNRVNIEIQINEIVFTFNEGWSTNVN